jgi:transposase
MRSHRSRHWTVQLRYCPAPRHARHDHKRNGTSSLFAALELASGKIIRSLHARHRAIEFKKFLQKIDQEVPADLDIHMILDNYSTHNTPQIQRWLAAHPRFHLHFTPTSASWINLVERWFAEPTTRKLRRGVHRTITELNTDIEDWNEHWNENPKPYAWTKTADETLNNLTRYCNTINASRH